MNDGRRRFFQILVRTAAIAAGVILCLILISWTADVFYKIEIFCFGPEHVVGVGNVIYTENGGCLYTNPMAMVQRHMLLFAGTAVLSAGCAMAALWLRICLRRSPSRFSRKIQFLFFCAVFSGIFLAAGSGFLAWQFHRDDQLWRMVRSCASVAEFERRFGAASHHCPQVTPENITRLDRLNQFADEEFALGKEVHCFDTPWPSRRLFVWLDHDRIVKITWCYL